MCLARRFVFFFFQAEDGIRDLIVTGVQTCALPICLRRQIVTTLVQRCREPVDGGGGRPQLVCGERDEIALNLRHLNDALRSEEHTSELQSRSDLVCRLLLEKKKK